MKPSFKMRGECAFIFEDIIDKALSLLNRQFNVDIRYIEKPKICNTKLYNIEIIEPDLITYPVHFDDIFKGLLEFRFTRKLNIKEINSVKDFLALSIKAPAQYYERYLLLDELQSHLQQQISMSSNNIVNFNYFKNLKNKQSGNEDEINSLRKSHPPIYIEGLNSEDKRNLAIELHHFLGYNSFVRFEDIKAHINSHKDIAELRDTTIYIENFEEITDEKKLVLLDFFTEPNIVEQPLVISSSSTDYAFLLKNTLDRTLLKFLSIYHIRLNKPLDEIKKEGFTTFLNNILKNPKHFITH